MALRIYTQNIAGRLCGDMYIKNGLQ
jgi:hypothetical protein